MTCCLSKRTFNLNLIIPYLNLLQLFGNDPFENEDVPTSSMISSIVRNSKLHRQVQLLFIFLKWSET